MSRLLFLQPSVLKSFIAGFVAVISFTFIKLKKHSFTPENIALDKDFLVINKDKNTAKNKINN
jgi:hypothetical protein